ncbi:MAG TPA: glycosyltransferase family 4 protein [Acidimicrobiales bacterium]|nr:glycosyltransferase family 4 protein [Acidimicrobiales bacterium]
MSRVLLASPYFAPKIGGVERYAHRLSVGLRDDHGHEVTVLTTHTGPDMERGEYDGLTVVRVPARWQLSATRFDTSWFSSVRRLIRSERPDVIITHAPVPGLADVCLAMKGDVPAIATYHSGSMRKHKWPEDLVIGAYESAVLPRLLARADAVVTTCPAGRGRYVPPGVDAELFRPDPATPPVDGLILYAGRIEHASAWKGIGTLLTAFKHLAAKRPEARLELAGGGDAVEHWRAVAEGMRLGERVSFSGELNGEALADAYRRASVFVLPSETESEAFGMVLIEAMACGTPVVASQVGGMPVVVESTGGGVLARPGDPMSLAEAIGGLLDDEPRRRALGAAGAEGVRRIYRWEAVTGAFNGLIEDLSVKGAGRRDRIAANA